MRKCLLLVIILVTEIFSPYSFANLLCENVLRDSYIHGAEQAYEMRVIGDLSNASLLIRSTFDPNYRSNWTPFSDTDELREPLLYFDDLKSVSLDNPQINFRTLYPHPKGSLNIGPVFSSDVVKSSQFYGEIWKNRSGQSFQYINASGPHVSAFGGRQQLIHELKIASADHPFTNISVNVNKTWLRAALSVRNMQAVASLRATDQYKSKAYLAKEDLYSLREYDISSLSNSDFFILLSESSNSTLNMESDEFYQHLAYFVRLARYSGFSHINSKLNLPSGNGAPSLPHFSRLPTRINKLVKSFFAQLSEQNKLRIGELTRFNRVQSNIPQEMKDHLMLQLLETARDPIKGVDLLILECDEGLVNFYKSEFGFEILTEISLPDAKTKEYLMYTLPASKKFNDKLDYRKQRSDSIYVYADSRSVKALESGDWTSANWKLVPEFDNGSAKQKRQAAQKVISEIRNEELQRININQTNSEYIPQTVANNIKTYSQNIKTPHSRLKYILQFSKMWTNALESISSLVYDSDRILVLGPDADLMSKYLSRANPKVAISTAQNPSSITTGLDQKFQRVIIADFSDQILNWNDFITTAASTTISDGNVIIAASFIEDMDWHNSFVYREPKEFSRPIQEEFMSIANPLLSENPNITEQELRDYWYYSRPKVSIYQITQMLLSHSFMQPKDQLMGVASSENFKTTVLNLNKK
jgi:hypothetical protein